MKWENVKIEDCCEVTSSKRIFLSEYVESGVPFYRSREIIEKSNGQEISEPLFIKQEKYDEIKGKFGVPKRGDMLLTSVGTIGIPYIVKEDDFFYFKDGNLTWFRKFNDRLDSLYLYYWFKSPKGQGVLYNTTIGSSQKALTIASLKRLAIPCPPIHIQKRVVEILSRYDDLIENNQKQIKLLEEAAQRLYKEWFADLRFPGHENTKIVDGVPDGWIEKAMGEICDAIGGGTPSTKVDAYYRNGRIKWATPTDITRKNGLILLDTEKKITEEGLAHSSAKIVPPYTILMTSRASVGFFGLCRHEISTNQGFISCIPYKENYRFYLLYNLLNRVEEIRAKASGSTFLEISKKNFRTLRIVLPSDVVLNLFTSQIQPMVKQMEVLTQAITELQEARDRLLPKLVGGEIEV